MRTGKPKPRKGILGAEGGLGRVRRGRGGLGQAGRGLGAGSWRAAATYLLIRDPLRLLQAEGAAKGAVLGHHTQAARGAHQLLGVAARGHLGGHDAATAIAPRPGPSPRQEPRPARVDDNGHVQSPRPSWSSSQ